MAKPTIKFKKRKKKKIKITAKTTVTKLPTNFFSVFKKDGLIKAKEATRKLAYDLAEEAKKIIKEQLYDWEPLSESYAKSKERKGLDPRILIATGDYVENGIGVDETGGKLFVGPLPGTHEPSGLPYKQIARWLEFGTWKMPARPLWRPLASIALRHSKILRKEYMQQIKAEAEKNGKKTTVTKKKHGPAT